MASLYNIAVTLNLEWLYNKTSDLGIDYKKGCHLAVCAFFRAIKKLKRNYYNGITTQ